MKLKYAKDLGIRKSEFFLVPNHDLKLYQTFQNYFLQHSRTIVRARSRPDDDDDDEGPAPGPSGRARLR